MISHEQGLKATRPYSSLRAWRKAHGFNQAQAADALGISQSYYSKLERHEQAPRRALAKRLMDQTCVPLEVLMGIAS